MEMIKCTFKNTDELIGKISDEIANKICELKSNMSEIHVVTRGDNNALFSIEIFGNINFGMVTNFLKNFENANYAEVSGKRLYCEFYN